MKTLNTLAKIGRVLSKIVFICCIVGAAGCLIGIVSLALLPQESFKLGGVSIHGLIEQSADMTMQTLYATMIAGIFLCAAEGVVARFAVAYFENILAAGTPFTLTGAKELQRLGILALAVPYGTALAVSIVWGIAQAFVAGLGELAMSIDTSWTLGALLIVGSVLCRAAAEQIGEGTQEISAPAEE